MRIYDRYISLMDKILSIFVIGRLEVKNRTHTIKYLKIKIIQDQKNVIMITSTKRFSNGDLFLIK